MLDDTYKPSFLQDAGWNDAVETLVGEDWSQRRISRLSKNGKTAILMHSVPDDQPQLTMGHKSGDYVKVDRYLTELGISVPKIFALDLPHGLMLVEDFGQDSFHEVLEKSDAERMELYLNATDVLLHLYRQTEHSAIELPEYYKGYIHTGHRRVIDWYAPALRRRKNEAGLAEAYLGVWKNIEAQLPPAPIRFLHCDFHPYNLMPLPERAGVRRVGLIDFQDAMHGPAPYDLANLLLDARRLVPKEIQAACLARFRSQMASEEWNIFYAWYRVLACQFHCRIIGQAYRLAVKADKMRLLAYLPVLQQHLKDDLGDPLLDLLASFFAENNIVFSGSVPEVSGLTEFIGEDAF